ALKRRFPQWTFPPDFDLFAIRNVLEKQALEEPLCYLVDAITLCARLSDNPFICIPPEDVGELPGWEDEEIAQLKDWWQEARVVHENAYQLAQWVETDPERRLSDVIVLLLFAYEKAKR
ncbi:MAG: hypothetical protein KDE09_12610, partial [Anaerolineales bacterium]|nr:hypothetical protein [Anaerolineales bacterium]